ncbi:MAG: hypothetical protein QOF58_5105 [Pseudonocardiales bacterium]|nr:hypothetical protein [Pseudonocardiales bacterium]
MDWARGQLVVEISNLLKPAAAAADMGFLDLQNALNGKEVCSRYSKLVDSGNPPSPILSEWARSRRPAGCSLPSSDERLRRAAGSSSSREHLNCSLLRDQQEVAR